MKILLDVRGLSKAFGGVHAVSNVSFSISVGELLALIGPNGAGKSTCFNMLNGQLKPDAGTVCFDGHNTTGLAPRAIWRLGVGRTFQVPAMFASMTVVENVQVALQSHRRHSTRAWAPARDALRTEAMTSLALVGMHGAAQRPCGALAYADLKRAELAVAIAHQPKLLLMDEPTAGMAPQDRRELMDLVRSLVRERGMSVLFTEHSMDVVFGYADRILVLSRGEMIAQGDARSVRDDPRVQEAYLGSGVMAAWS